jgi:predicted ATPase/class 3 adenylate cyclase
VDGQRRELPKGRVAFVFTDIEGSTVLLRRLGSEYRALLREHRGIIRDAVERAGGTEVDTEGDGFFLALPSARTAVEAMVSAQRRLLRHAWPHQVEVRVRVGIHVGEAHVESGDYVGLDVHRAARIAQAAHGGQILVSATAQEELLHDRPPGVEVRDLGEHLLKDLPDAERLFQIAVDGLPDRFPAPRTLGTTQHNLPAQLTAFVGREEEISTLTALLEDHRLVTVTGPGGVGKTRLAIETGRASVDRRRDGVRLVELAGVPDPDAVLRTVADVLGVGEQEDRTLVDLLIEALRGRQLLLILDNSEHVLSAVADVTGHLLAGCADLRILATSREPLGLRGEVTHRLGPLHLPQSGAQPDDITASEAVALFVARARASDPTIALGQSELHAIADICRQVEGIPLAIELAAARVPTLSLDEVRDRLADRFALLTTRDRTDVAHHRTLRATIDWSHDHLTEAERTLLRRASVFRRFGLFAAEAVCAGDGIGEGEVLDLVERLVDRSLLTVDQREPDARYSMLDMVREYARERLDEAGETTNLRGRHRDFILDLAGAHRDGRLEQGPWVVRMEAYHDDLRAAIAWSIESGDTEGAIRLTTTAWWFWYAHGHHSEGLRWLQQVTDTDLDVDPALLSAALRAEGIFALHQGAYDLMEQLGEEAVRLARQADDEAGVASSLTVLAGPFLYRQRLDEAEEHLNAAMRSWASLVDQGDRSARGGIAYVTGLLGDLAYRRGDLDTAYSRNAASLELYREIGTAWGIGRGLNHLATISLHRGDLEPVAGWLDESIRIYTELEDDRAMAWCLLLQGLLAREHADLDRAEELLRLGLEICQEVGDRWGTAQRLEALAEVARRRGESRRGARLAGAALALREGIEAPLPPAAQAELDRTLDGLRESLGDDHFEQHLAVGRALDLDTALAEALG